MIKLLVTLGKAIVGFGLLYLVCLGIIATFCLGAGLGFGWKAPFIPMSFIFLTWINNTLFGNNHD